MGRLTTRRQILRIDQGVGVHRRDYLAVEEPLEIRINGSPLAVTMRTPGHDFDLALGFLVSEGVITHAGDVVSVRYCAGASVDDANPYNVVDIRLADGVAAPDPSIQRSFYTTSSCGVCGKASLDAVRTQATWSVREDPLQVDAELIARLPGELGAAQAIFQATGGLHAAGIATASGALACVREDVGRHNAVDKVIGDAVRNHRLPVRSSILVVSGRASFELVQKAVMAGIPMLVAVSAPSSLAIELADEAGLTVAGFVRGQSMNVYSAPHRVCTSSGT